MLQFLIEELKVRVGFRPSARVGSPEHFHEQVSAAMRILTPYAVSMPLCISNQAIAVALAMNLVACYSKVIADGEMTSEEVQRVILRIARLEFKDSHILRDPKGAVTWP